MKKIIVVAAVLAVMLSSCGMGGTSKPKTDLDSVSYALGILIATDIYRNDSTLNADLIAKGLIDGYSSTPKISADSAMQIQQEYVMVKLPKKTLKASEDFLANIEKENANAVKTESGLIYEIIEAGDQDVKAAAGDTIFLKYTGTFKDGMTFDKTDETPRQFVAGQLVKGANEGLALIGKGGKIKLWIHPDLGYGMGNPMRGMPANEALVFDFEIVDVTPGAAVEPDAAE